jgi:thiol-disulfide isomerase/thioredoxin
MDRKPTRRRSTKKKGSIKSDSVVDTMKDNGMSITVCVLGLVLIILVIYLFFEHRNTVIIPSNNKNCNCGAENCSCGAENFACGKKHENFACGKRHNNTEQFQNRVKQLVCILASGCGHCRTLKPTLDNIEREYPNINLVRYEDNEEKNREYHVTGFPSIFCVLNGEKKQFEGSRTVRGLVDFYNSCE